MIIMKNYTDKTEIFTEGEFLSKVIEHQERCGQADLIKAQRLPKKHNSVSLPDEMLFKGVVDTMTWEEREAITTQNNIAYTKEQYEKMGIKIINEYDDLFWNVNLPDGWEIKATNHSMWNELFDDKGRKRANFFFKASFHDRDAFINFNTRFHIRVDHIADASEDYEIWKASDFQGVAKDGEVIIYCTECLPATGSYKDDNKIQKDLKASLELFMEEHYPNYEDINAYWD